MLLLVVLCRLKSPRRSYFTLVKSLTVADMLLPFCFFMFILFGRPDLVTVETYVINIITRFNTYFASVILFHLMCLAAEHFVAIMKPLRYEEWCRRRYIVCRLVLGWTFPFLLIILEETVLINFIPDSSILAGLIVVCFLIMLVVYIIIFCEIQKQQRFTNSQNNHAQKNYRSLVTTILIVATFFLCWMPHVVTMICFVLDVEKSVMQVLFEVSNISCVNSICDAFIYSIRLTEVKKVWRRTFCCVGPCSHSSDNQRMTNEITG